jgi:hypothetical protein
MQHFLGRLPLRLGLVAVAVTAVPFLGASAASADNGDLLQPVDNSHNVLDAPAPVSNAVFGSPPGTTKPGVAICTTPVSAAANVNTDCETNGPHNETSIAVNPTNPLNIIGGANDYQLGLNPGGQVSETVLSRAHVTVDGGRTWSQYPVFSDQSYQATGDPALAFDADGHAYYGTLGFRFVGSSALNPDVLVSNSGDGGRDWTTSRVAAGSGTFGSVGDLLDKEYVAAWGHGNAIVTFGDFRLGQLGRVLSSRIFSSVTHDSGATWSTPLLISGTLDQAFVSVPTVAADGRIYVAFMNTGDLLTGRDTYETVEVSPSTGARVAGPFPVGLVIDGFTDYPVAFGRQTYQDSVFRSWAAGNITTDPTNPAHLAVVWSDMRDSALPAPSDPYQAVTNSDVIVSQSFDRGRTWSTPTAIKLANDQFMPWGAYDAAGALRIGMFDRSGDPANHTYNYSLATQTTGNRSSIVAASTVASDPTTDDRWFARNVNPNFPNATAFLGDYSNIAVVPGTTTILAYWTDLRATACFGGVCRHGEDAEFTQIS